MPPELAVAKSGRSVMTDTAIAPTEAAGEYPAHPLDTASAAEYLAGRQILAASGLLGESIRFAYYGLEEPVKHDVLEPPDGQPADRRLRAVLVDDNRGESRDAVGRATRQRGM